ncbi:hypothetical protein [Frigoriglobus tundricola]|uniref:Uncharacterized protein n=1 Tax=Frigoriglobus tundricola TaxID=2774151 RepID=A0A6M5Z5F3_9BACT|nr:hypothetical protein [Frigoriglobus tundricola]QJX00671.1 hypothetical protein FTUN_8303 [Frigoriglobus tundricola]
MVSSASLRAACFVTFVAALATLWAQRERMARTRQAESLHREDLVERVIAQRHQFEVAAAIVARLAVGKVTLAEAVVELQSVFQGYVRVIVLDLGKYFRGRKPTDHEVLAYYAISKIRSRGAADSPCQRAALRRLEEEYRALFDRLVPAD